MGSRVGLGNILIWYHYQDKKLYIVIWIWLYYNYCECFLFLVLKAILK